MASTMRQRVLSSSSPSISTLLSKSSRKIINPLRQSRTDVVDGSLGWFMPVFALGVLRYMSAMSNILHDCDEVFNYWEPLHFLLYKSGFQTWEYSSQYALRSYLYISVHEFVGRPAAWLFGEEKVRVFYAVRLLLGTISVVVDATLVVALSRKYGKRLASYALAMLCLTSGCFFSSTSFLPSSFSMYAMSLSSGLFLLQIYSSSIAVAAVGVLLGWPFSILAFMPIAFCSLIRRFRPAFFTGLAISIFTFVLSVLVDCHFYGRWTSSIANLLLYNVFEGESHLYGTEGKLFYLWNGLNNFNLCFILALLFLLFWPIVKRKHHLDLLIVVSPLYLWLMFMCLQPHKEERFIYPIYPLICVAASAVIEIFPDIFEERYHLKDYSITIMISKFLRPVVLGLILCASHSRTFSIINGYGAPLEIYNILDHHDDVGNGSVLCVGSEWHRFPSSFFVPNYIAEIRWIDDGFQGLLPFPFNSTLGGTGTATATAPLYFNNKNKASFEQFLYDLNKCTFLVELQLNRSHHFHGNDLSKWETIAALPYLDREVSPPVYRSFFIPHLWQKKNVFGMYKLLRRADI